MWTSDKGRFVTRVFGRFSLSAPSRCCERRGRATNTQRYRSRSTYRSMRGHEGSSERTGGCSETTGGSFAVLQRSSGALGGSSEDTEACSRGHQGCSGAHRSSMGGLGGSSRAQGACFGGLEGSSERTGGSSEATGRSSEATGASSEATGASSLCTGGCLEAPRALSARRGGNPRAQGGTSGALGGFSPVHPPRPGVRRACRWAREGPSWARISSCSGVSRAFLPREASGPATRRALSASLTR